MENIKLFTTLIKKDAVGGDDEYVLATIRGMRYVACEAWKQDSTLPYIDNELDEGHVLSFEGNEEQYETFVAAVNRKYPDLCQFNYMEPLDL